MKGILNKLLAMMIAVFAFVAIIPAAGAAQIKVIELTVPTPVMVEAGNSQGWGRPQLKFMGGWIHNASWRKLIFCMNSKNGQVVYCIEPGISIADNYQEDDHDESFWKTHPGNDTIDAETIKAHIGRIFKFGYKGNANAKWNSANAAHATEMAEAIATQLLVWEVIVGERDEDFGHIDATQFGYNNLLEEIADDNPIRAQIMTAYNKIVNGVQQHLIIPSFSAELLNIAPTYTMEWKNGEYTLTLTDTKGVLNGYEFTSNDPKITFAKSENQLTIKSAAMPDANTVITAQRTDSKRFGVVTWSGNKTQTVVSHGDQIADPITGYFKLKADAVFGSLHLAKTSEDGNVSGIGFTIAGQGVSLHKTTDENGVIDIAELEPGTYTVTEDASDLYVAQEPQTVTIKTNETATVSFHNVLKRGSVNGIKVDDEGKALAGAKIAIFAAGTTEFTEENAIAVTTTKANGKFSFSNLLYGNYVVKELAAPTGYILSSEEYPVTVGETTNPVSIKIVNERARGSVNGLKIDDAGNKLAGAKIAIFAAGTTEFTEENAVAVTTTKANGKFSFEGLLYGDYIVKELAAPSGYVLSAQEYPVTVGETTNPVSIEIVNTLIRGSVDGLKIDNQGSPLAGATIGLFNADETDFNEKSALKTVVSGEDGAFGFDDISFGKYLVREIAAPEGYVLSDEIFSVDIAENGRVIKITIENTLILGSVNGIKVDNAGNNLADALFGLFAAGTTEFIEENAIATAVSAEDGSFSFSDLVYGEYIIKELAAPTGYVLSSEEYPVKIGEHGQVIEIEVVNTLIVGAVDGVKIDDKGNRLAGAMIGLFAEGTIDFTEENSLATAVSGKDGSFAFTGLLYGEYLVREIKAPNGYYLSDEIFSVEISEHGKTIEITIVNVPTPPPPVPRTGGFSILPVAAILLASSAVIPVIIKKRRDEG